MADEIPSGDIAPSMSALTTRYAAAAADLASLKDAKASLFAAQGSNPDTTARALKIASQLGVPVDTVERNLPDFEAIDKVNRYDALLRSSPTMLKRWMAEPVNARLIGDDLPVLAGTASLWRGLADTGRSTVAGLVRMPGTMMEGLGYGADVLASGFGAVTGLRPKGQAKNLPWYLDPAELLKAGGKYFKDTADMIDTPPERRNLVDEIAGGVGQIAGQLTLLMATGGAGGLVMLFGQGADQMADDVKKAGKMGTWEGDAALIGGGMLTAIAEKLGLDLLVKRLPPAIKNKLARAVVDIAAAGGIEAAEEAIEQVGQNALSNYYLETHKHLLDGTLESAIPAGGSAAFVRALLMGGGRVRRRQVPNPDQAATDVIALDQVLATTRGTGLASRSPDKLAEVLGALGDSGKVYVPAHAVRAHLQTLDPQEAQQQVRALGIDGQLEQAMATGGDVVIPLHRYVAHAPAAMTEAWRDDLRLRASGLSVNEARAFKEGAGELGEAITGRMEEAVRQIAARDRVVAAVEQQARAAGEPPDVARQIAQLYGERYATRAARLGQGDAVSQYDRSGVSFRAALPDSLRQAPASDFDRLIESVKGRRDSGGAGGEADTKGPSILQFIARNGGIVDEDGALAARKVDRWHEGKPFQRPALRDAMGTSDGSSFGADGWTQRLWENGYFPEHRQRPTVDHLHAAIDEELRGAPRHAAQQSRGWRSDFNAVLADAEELLKRAGIDTRTATADEIRKALIDPEGRSYDQAEHLREVEKAWRAVGLENFMSERDGVITLHKIIVPEGEREQGKATAAMRELVDYADRTGQRIVLTPSGGFGGGKARLIDFYKGFGFVENKGRRRDFGTRALMYRDAVRTYEQRDTFPAEFMSELAQVDELFRYPITKASTPEKALHDIDPSIRFMGDVTREDERSESGAERRLMFRTKVGHDFYLYEDDRKFWINVSELNQGEGGSAIYAALFDYATNTDRQFIGDPAPMSDIALRRRTEAMLSSAIKHGSTDHMEPHPRQIAGDEALGVPPLSWHDGDTLGNIQSLIDVSLASLSSKVPEFQRARYDFATRTFRTGEGKPLTDGTLARWADGKGRDREAGAGSATYKRGILLNTLVRAGSGERPGLLERVLSQPRQQVGASARKIFYQRGDGGRPLLTPRGSIAFTKGDGDRLKAAITLFKGRNRSTVLHETGHLWLEELHADAALPHAPEQLKTDLAMARAYLGAEDDAPLTVEQHERWARTVEAYFIEGKAPSAALAGVLARFKQWLISIYRTVRRLNVEISDEVRGVLDRLIATDEAIAEAQAEAHARPLFASAAQAGMTDAEFAAYGESVAGARERAVQTVLGRQRQGDLAADGAIEAEALAALHNEARADMLAAELRALARKAGTEPTPYALARDWARHTIAGKTVAEIGDIEAYARAEARAAFATEAALAKGDIGAALQRKLEQVIAHALWREAYDARRNVASELTGPVGGAVILTGTGGLDGNAKGLVGALARAGVDVSDADGLARALQDKALMERIREDATINGANKGGEVSGTSQSVRDAEPVPTIAGPTGKAYSVAFETKLDPSVWSKSRKVHFHRANAALDEALRSDPVWAAQMEELIPGLQASVAKAGTRLTPDGWVWHHDIEAGTMQLTPVSQHTDPKFRNAFHPNGRGGYAIWARPAGAPQRKRKRT